MLESIWWSLLMFVAGTVVGAPLWNWAKQYFPWNKG
jgi:hypothetical protein